MNNPVPDNLSEKQDSIAAKEKTKNGSPLNSLSPIDDADKDGHYGQMLLWALENREEKDIKNIALTGPYGSGKTSIIKTFEKKYKSDKLVFLNISLATFKEEKGVPASKIKSVRKEGGGEKEENKEPGAALAAEKQALLRLVELSILQQIFYHEKDEDIPDTRFKKTRSLSEESASKLTWGIFLFGISFLYLFYSKEIWDLFGITPNKCLNIFFHCLAIFVLLSFGFFFIKNSIRPLRSIQLRKFNFQDAEFAVDDSISKSILNEHLDELLYFFQVTPYTVVVFEDLDRFEQTEIFTKLRELNHLINYSKKMNGRKVAFVYAVRDEMFQDKDRTKFFDFIIPVIPVINSSNSNEILRDIVKANNYNIKKDLLDDISFFVDDMRLLYNIMNEYYLYHKKLEIKDQNIMLAMVVYKNIYPNDFVALSNGDGELFKAIEDKEQYVKGSISKLEAEIDKYRAEIQSLENLAIHDLKELRKLYILEYLAQNPKIAGFIYSNQAYPISQASEDDTFRLLIDNKMLFSTINDSLSGLRIQKSFEEIEKLVDPNKSYQERQEQIEDKSNDRIEDLKEDIFLLEERKNKLRNASLQGLLNEDLIQLVFKNQKQHQLVSILMRGGYIDENYMDYISFFYEGSISKPDKEFLLNVKAHIRTEFNHKLIKINKLISKIPSTEFEHDYVLNYHLLDHLLAKKGNNIYRSKIFQILSRETQNSISFIDGYIDESKHPGAFIKELAHQWEGIWFYLNGKSDFTSDRLSVYFKLIIEHADIADLQRISKQSNFIHLIEDNPNFLSILKDERRLKQVIKELNVKFTVQNLETAPHRLVDFLYEGNHYEINEGMLTAWTNFKGDYDESKFNEQNYTFINNQPEALEKLIDYIDSNMGNYIENVWRELESPKKEDPEFLVHMINNTGISLELKRKIVRENATKIRYIEALSSLEVMQLVMNENKLVAIWHNLFTYYKLNVLEFDDHILKFLNNSLNVPLLSLVTFEYKNTAEDKAAAEKFAKALILKEEIKDEFYAKLILKMPWHYNHGLAFETLSEEKVKLLLGILNLTKENYNLLRGHYRYLNVELLNKDEKKLMSNLADFEMDEDDIAEILTSEKLTVESKNIILHQLTDEAIIANKKLLNNVGRVAANSDDLTITKEVATAILSSDLDAAYKIPLYLRKMHLYDQTDFFELMSHFGKNFNEIKRNGKQTVIRGTETNWEFARAIYQRGYTYEPKQDKKGIRIRNLKTTKA